jgi:hypothetical protein
MNNECICGHKIEDHIYFEGACRPGFICDCIKFVTKDEWLRESESSGV